MRDQRQEAPGLLTPINVGLGLCGGIAVGSASASVGGSWLAIPLCALLGIFAGKFLSAEVQGNSFWRKLAINSRRIRTLPRLTRIIFAFALVGIVAAFDAISDAIDLPIGIYLYMIPIFLSSLFLGRKAAIASLLLSLVLVVYLVIPPRFSFSIATSGDVFYFGVFIVLASIVLMITSTQVDLSKYDNKKLRGARSQSSPQRFDEAESDTVVYLRKEAYRLTQIARSCSDSHAAHELEGVSVELMERAAQLNRLFKLQ